MSTLANPLTMTKRMISSVLAALQGWLGHLVVTLHVYVSIHSLDSNLVLLLHSLEQLDLVAYLALVLSAIEGLVVVPRGVFLIPTSRRPRGWSPVGYRADQADCSLQRV